MSRKLNQASAIAVAATMLTILVSSDGAGAAAQATLAPVLQTEPSIEVVTPQVAGAVAETTPEADVDLITPVTPPAATLGMLVSRQPQPAELSRELNCLAGAIFFEAKSESLAGQLAVGRVVVARSKSGRFPNSYCGVVYQPSQFSFVRGSTMPSIPRASRQWKNAVAIAQIAHSGSWQSPVEGALFFHAKHVSPGWRLKRLAQVDNHVFYR